MTVEEYVDLPWTWQYEEDPEDPGTIIVTIAELEDFFSAGKSREEAYATGRDALACLIEGYLEDGDPIPLPPGVAPATSR